MKSQKVDEMISRMTTWREAFVILREIMLETGLDEQLKWGFPTYMLKGKNVAIIQAFKSYCAVLFVKGALLHNDDHKLIQQTKNVRSSRQLRFFDTAEIIAAKPTLTRLVAEAKAVEEAGLSVDFKAPAPIVVEVFENALSHNPALASAFKKLTPGRQRAYLLYFSGAKQAATQQARVDKYIPAILDGKGLYDQGDLPVPSGYK